MSEITTLIDEQDIGGYKVRPWGIVQLAKLSPVFERVTGKLKSEGITFKDLTDKEGMKLDSLIFILLPEVPSIFSITLNLTEEEVGKIPPQLTIAMLMTMLMQNMETLKNSFGLISVMIKQMTA